MDKSLSSNRGSGRGRGRGRGGRGRGSGGRAGRGPNKRTSSSTPDNATTAASHKSGSRPPNKRVKRSNICFQFAETGSCERGDACKFLHKAATTDPPVPSANSSNDEPMEDVVLADNTVQEDSGTTPPATASTHITSHLFSELNIHVATRRALQDVFRYEFMTVVQHETLPLVLTGEDCLAKAKTGTGKTLAFMIPTIEKMLSNVHHAKPSNDICSLVISPTRELALQITAETKKLLQFHKQIQVVTCVGGTNINKDIRALKGNVQIVVATPGRLLDHLANQGLAKRMERLDTLIFDEADQLLDMGFRPDIERILNQLQPSKQSRQTLLFSATVPKSVSEIAGLALRPKYHFVDTVGEEAEQTHQHVTQELFVAPQEQQVLALLNILVRETRASSSYKIIVFFTTARLTGFMAELFNSVSKQTRYNVLEIHSRKSQGARQQASNQFRAAKSAVLFSSDVSARGMDYPDVTFVLQVGLTDRAQYIHRLGRTARAGKEGKGALLLAPYEERHMLRELKDMPLGKKEIPSEGMEQIATLALSNVEKNRGLKVSAQQSYRAWLGYYNSSLKKVGWDKKQLVVQANSWAQEHGLKDQPGLEKRTVGKMGLKGVPGLKLEAANRG